MSTQHREQLQPDHSRLGRNWRFCPWSLSPEVESIYMQSKQRVRRPCGFSCVSALTKSGLKPALRTSLMACCVGFVFCSPLLIVSTSSYPRHLPKLLTRYHWNERNVNLNEVVLACTSTQLTEGFDKGSRFNVTYSRSITSFISLQTVQNTCDSTQLNDTCIRLFVCVIDRDLSNSFNPVLDSICNVWNDFDASIRAQPLA